MSQSNPNPNPMPPVLILPGWLGSGPQHWQGRWHALHGDVWVQQHDWQRPLRGDWTAQLNATLLAQPVPVLLAAHSLGCILTAWWASHAADTSKVLGALLVAPPDIEREDNRQKIPGWAPLARQKLPFKSTLVASQNDPFGAIGFARQLAADWGSQFVDVGEAGHINAESGLGDWPQGREWLRQLATP